MTTYTAKQITDIGGQDWKGRRVYLNDWPALVGLEIGRYKSGGISGATLDGQDISNARAGQILSAKVYLNVDSGELVIARDPFGKVPRSWDDDRIREAVAAAVGVAA